MWLIEVLITSTTLDCGLLGRIKISDLLRVIRSSTPSLCPLRPLPNRQKPTAYHGQK